MAFSRKFIINLFQFVGVEGFVTAIVDVFGSTLRKGYRKEIFIAVSCFVMYLVGLSMVAEASLLHICVRHYANTKNHSLRSERMLGIFNQ